MSTPPSHLVIIGAGIQGASVAYFTSKLSPTTRITVVESNPTIAPHASGKGGGFLARSWGDGSVTQELHHRSFDLHEELAAEWNLASYRKLPVLSVQPGSSEFKKNKSTPNWLDGLGGGTSRMGDGSDTAQVSPFEFTSEALLRSNAAVLTSSTVSSISTSSNGDEVTSVELTSGESIECDGVVVCMGPWSCLASSWFPTITVPMVGIKSTSIVWPRRSNSDGVALFCGEDNEFNTHLEVYPRPNGEIYCCGVGGSEYVQDSDLKDNLYLDATTCNAQPSRVEAAKKSMHKMSKTYKSEFPDGPETTQACMRPCPPDALPIISTVPGYKNAFINAGHNCWGILWAPISGKILSEMVVKGRSSVNIEAFDVRRFGVREIGKKQGERGRRKGSEQVGEQW
ncbi:hypothetical protein TrST_g9485 [Triparma strigata]|uniref:FAD dependent oxidoreductase domain-containing protein n=1 Tax=Triparma strigata TaxID=1606541 RepID=A0A9W7AVE0_9STRA|nr:hypothetical protein TrST_g9485 [Triparma strigata]